jgi:hypothetical protein
MSGGTAMPPQHTAVKEHIRRNMHYERFSSDKRVMQFYLSFSHHNISISITPFLSAKMKFFTKSGLFFKQD